MKKKVFIGILAALLLFAFTACEGGNQTSLVGGAGVYTNDKVYLPGEVINPSDFEFYSVDFYNNRTSVSSSDVVFAGDIIAGDSDTYTGKYLGVWDVTIIPTIGDVKKIDVDGSNAAVKTYYKTDSSEEKYTNDLISLEGVKIVATYTVGSDKTEQTREIAVDNSKVSAEIADWNTTGSVDVTVKYSTVDPDTFKVTLAENKVVSVALKTSKDYVVWTDKLGKANDNGTFDYDATGANGIYLELTMNNGETKKAAETDVRFPSATGAAYDVSDVASVSLDKASSLTAEYIGENQSEGLKTVSEPISVTVTKDYIEGISVNLNSKNLVAADFTDTTAYKDDAAVIKGMFGTEPTVTGIWASSADDTATATTVFGYKGAGDATGLSYSITNPATLNFKDKIAGQVVTLEFTATVNGQTDPIVETVEATIGTN